MLYPTSSKDPITIEDPGCVPGRWFANGIPHGLPHRYHAKDPRLKAITERLIAWVIFLLVLGPAIAAWPIYKSVFTSDAFILSVGIGLLIRLSLWAQRR